VATSTLVLTKAKVYNLSFELIAHLENVYNVAYELRENQIWNASFELPVGDEKNAFCLDNYYVELFDTVGTRIELFRIIEADTVRRQGKLYVRYECEHALASLLDSEFIVNTNGGPDTSAAIATILAEQDVVNWQLGTCDFARNFLYYWPEGTSLLAALWSIADRLYDESWQWTFDTSSYPWTLNLVEPGDDVVAVIDYRLNMEELKRKRDARKIVNKLYPRGNGSGIDQLTIMSINITGAATTVGTEADPDQKDVIVASAVGFAPGSHVYLENSAGEWEINDVDSVVGSTLTMDNDLLHTYDVGSVCHIGEEFVEDATSQTTNGPKVDTWKDGRYTNAQNLYDAAIARLDDLKVPAYTYTSQAVDLFPLTGEHKFILGELVRIRDNDLDILVDARVTVLKKRDVSGKPYDIEVQFQNKVPVFGENFGQIVYADDLDGVGEGCTYSKVYTTQVLAGRILLSAVPGGPIGSMPNPPTEAGTIVSAEFIGIHDGTNWITYMDNAARLIADDGTGDAYFRWDPTLVGSAKLQIKGDVSITGTLSASQIVGGTLDFSAIGKTGLSVLLAEMSNNSVGSNQIIGRSVTTGKLFINADLDFRGSDLYNVDGIRGFTGTSNTWIDLRNHQWFGFSTSSYVHLAQDVSLRGSRDLTLDAQGGDMYFRKGGTTKRWYYYDTQLFSGKSGLNLYFPVTINGTDYHYKLYN